MNLKLKKMKITLWAIFLPVTVLLLLIFLLLYHFGSVSRITAKSVVENDILTETENFASKVREELDIMTRMGIAFCEVMENWGGKSKEDILRRIGVLCEHSSAYMVVYCDENGKGFTHNDISVNVKKDEYLLKENAKNQYYAYLQRESIMKAEALISVIPLVTNNDTIDGYILMYYSVSHIRDLFTRSMPYDNTFMLFSVDDGLIITMKGLNEKPPVNVLLPAWFNQKEATLEGDTILEALMNKGRFSFFATVNERLNYVVCTPVNINDWYITVGYDNDLYNDKLDTEWSDIKKLISYLLIAILVFLISMIAITSTIYFIYNKKNKTLQIEANTDLLTTLYNKVTTEKKIKEYINKNSNLRAVLFILDVDDFKGINDTMGHQAGDEILKTFGNYLKKNLNENSIIGRVGGDEFFIFLTHIESGEELQIRIKHAYELIREFKDKNEMGLSATFSVGLACYPKDGNNFDTLFNAADQALYIAKKKGKNQMVQYSKH